MTTYGLTTAGFVSKQQATIITEIQTAIQNVLGIQANLLSTAALGQLVGVFSEREALIWQLAESVYVSQYPSGAEGTSVDNLLAMIGLTRLPATATATQPTSVLGVPGLQCLGTVGTVIPVNSLINVTGSSPLVQFKTTAAITINAAVNAIQTLSLYGGAPTTGSFSLNIVDPAGRTLTTGLIPWNASATASSFSFTTSISSGTAYLAIGAYCLPITSSTTNSGLQASIRGLNSIFSAVTVATATSGYGFAITWNGYAPLIASNSTALLFSAVPTGGSIILTLGGTTVATLAYNASTAQVQSALQSVAGYSAITVSGSIASQVLYVNWNGVTPATIAVTTQPTGSTISVATNSLSAGTQTVAQSIGYYINALYDAVSANLPYTDVAVSGSLASQNLTLTFGGNTPYGSNPSSGSQVQNNFGVASTSLMNGTVVVNIGIVTQTAGIIAQGTGAAICTQTGVIPVNANALTTIGTPVSGWSSVNNPLACITGTLIETDDAALTRRAAYLSQQATGTATAIAAKVQQLTGVTQAIGFNNESNVALQLLNFSLNPTTGSIVLTLPPALGPTAISTQSIPWNAQANIQTLTFSAVPASGQWHLDSFFYQLGTTAPSTMATTEIPYNATAAQIQTYLQTMITNFQAPALSAPLTVSGSYSTGFLITNCFPLQFANDSLPSVTAAVVTSLQAQINALAGYNPVQVSGSYATGFTFFYNNASGGAANFAYIQPGNNTLLSSSSNVTATFSFGRSAHSFEILVNGNLGVATPAEIAAVIYANKPSGIQAFASPLGNGYTVPITDAYGNVENIGFSTPIQVPIYVSIVLQTDLSLKQVPLFNPGSIVTIQNDIVAIGNSIPIGGLIVAQGTNGLVGAFNSIPGIVGYQLTFGTSANPTQSANIQLQAEQAAQFETYLVVVSYS